MGEVPGPIASLPPPPAAATGAVALVKGPLTAVGLPMADDGLDVLLARAGSTRLATAGTGDVLSGIIGALLARGVEAPWRPHSAPTSMGGRPARQQRGAGGGGPPSAGSALALRSSDPGEPARSIVSISGSRTGATVAEGRTRPAWAEVDVSAIRHNIGVLRRLSSRQHCARWSRPTPTATGRPRWGGGHRGRRGRPRRRPGRRGVELRESKITAPILVLSDLPPGGRRGGGRA